MKKKGKYCLRLKSSKPNEVGGFRFMGMNFCLQSKGRNMLSATGTFWNAGFERLITYWGVDLAGSFHFVLYHKWGKESNYAMSHPAVIPFLFVFFFLSFYALVWRKKGFSSPLSFILAKTKADPCSPFVFVYLVFCGVCYASKPMQLSNEKEYIDNFHI